MPMVPAGHKTLVHYPDGTSKVITLYVRPAEGQVIAHGWEVRSVEAGEHGDAGGLDRVPDLGRAPCERGDPGHGRSTVAVTRSPARWCERKLIATAFAPARPTAIVSRRATAVAGPPSGGRRLGRSFSPSSSLSSSGSRETSPRILSSSASCCGLRLERDAAGEDGGALLEAVHVDEVVRPERGRAPLVGAAGAEEMRELEHERDQVDRDQEREEELDVLLHGRARLLDALERRLAGEEVAVRLDRGDAVRDLAALGGPPDRDLARFAAIVAAIWGRARFSSAAAAAAWRGVALVVRPTADLVGL